MIDDQCRQLKTHTRRPSVDNDIHTHRRSITTVDNDVVDNGTHKHRLPT